MTDSRKKLIAQISILEKLLNQQEEKLADNKHYLADNINGRMLLFFILIVPAFLWGWRSGRKEWFGKTLKYATEASTVAASAYLKKHLLNLIM